MTHHIHRIVAIAVASFVLAAAIVLAPDGAAYAQTKPRTVSPFTGEPLTKTDAATLPAPTSNPRRNLEVMDAKSASQLGGDRLEAMQYTDGSWGWPLTAPPTYSNVVGPIGMGVAQAYRQTADAGMYSTLSDAGTYLLAKTNNFSPSDGYLAAELDRILGGTAYTSHVKTNFYDQLAAGTYNRSGAGTLYSTATYVALIRTSRASQGIANLAAWDIAMGLVGAAECGASTADWIAGVKAEIDELDSSAYYDVLGLAGALYGLAFVGEEYDPTAGAHAAASNLADLAAILASYQIAGGGFAWNSAYVIPDDGDESIQETGYAILALSEVDRATYLSAIQGAADYLMSVQLGTGGWENYTGNGENNEVTAEALWGITVAYPPPVHNVTKDVYYSTIQGAINNASAGDFIAVGAGTYNEQVTVGKGLTIVGDTTTPENVVIDGQNTTGYSVDGQVRIYNPTGPVVFRGFKIVNGGTSSSGGYYGILTKGPYAKTIQDCKLYGHGGSVALGDDYAIWAYAATGEMTIRNVYMTNFYHAILLERQAGATIVENNTFDALYTGYLGGIKYGGRAIEAIVYGTTDITSLQRISGNQFVNFQSTGIIYSGGFAGQTPRKYTNVVIENNNFDFSATDITNNFGAINLRNVSGTLNDDPAGGVTADIHNNTISVPSGSGIIVTGLNGAITVHDNSIAGTPYGVKADASLGPVIDASGNWWGSNDPATLAGNVTANVDYTPWLDTGADVGDPGFHGDYSTLWVDDNSPQTGAAGRIAEGIGLVTASTVNVAAGTYVEGPQVVINKNVSVVGAGKLTTIITPSANTSNSGDGRGWFLVNPGYTFNLSNVTLDGTGRLVAMGILHKGSGTIDNCRFKNIKYNESGPEYLGIGMSVRETAGMNVNVSNSEFSGMGRIGLHYRGPGTTGTINGCTFTGKGPGNWLDYGIEAGGAPLPQGGARLTITNCTVSGNKGVASVDGSTSGGILVTTYYGPGTQATITGCTLTDNTDGLIVGYDAADASVVTASNNVISGNTGHGVVSTNPYVDARNNYWGTLHGPADPLGTIEVPKMPAPSVADAVNALPAAALGNAVNENVDYWPWNGPASGHAQGGIWASGYVNPTANDIFMGLDTAALDGVDPMDTVAPPPPPSDYLYLYSLLAPGMPIENYSVDIRKQEASLATTAKGWDLRALTDHTSETVNLAFLLDALPAAFHPTLHDLTTGGYKDLSTDPTYSYTSPAGVTPSAFRLLIGDSTKPAAAVTSPNGGEYLIVGTPYNITWTSSDATGVLKHYIYYSGTGAAPYTIIDSVNGATFTYAWTPLAAASTASIKVTARDSVMNEESDISDNSFTILASSVVSYGATAGWNLVSVPMLQGTMTPAAVFGDDYGATPYYTFQFNPASGYSVPSTLTMGRGYWLGSNSAQLIDADGTPLSAATLPLASGFNIIGNPFASNMAVADLAFTDGLNTYDIANAALAGWLSNVLYGYDGTSYYVESSTLGLWNGYWVPMLADGISAVYSPTVTGPTPKAVPVVETEPDGWSVGLEAALKTDDGAAAGDRIAAFGVRSGATVAFSPRYDAPRPPRAPADTYIEVSFAGADEAFRSRFGDAVYARKFMPADRAGWEVVVKTSAPGEVTLRWDNAAIAALPGGVKVDLFDAATGATVDMKRVSSYTYTQQGSEQRFRINRPAGVIPAAWELSQNYPNPFNPTTTIAYGLPADASVSVEVFNFLGQRVATLLSGDAVQSAGYHEVTFNAATLASGFYYYTLTAKGVDGSVFTDVRKMILMK